MAALYGDLPEASIIAAPKVTFFLHLLRLLRLGCLSRAFLVVFWLICGVLMTKILRSTAVLFPFIHGV